MMLPGGLALGRVRLFFFCFLLSFRFLPSFFFVFSPPPPSDRMAGSILKKRKAPAREELATNSGSGDDIQGGLLNGALADSESEDEVGDDSSSEDGEVDKFPENGSEVGSDEIPPSDEEVDEKDEEGENEDEDEDEDEDEGEGEDENENEDEDEGEDEEEDEGEDAAEADEYGRKTVLDSTGNLRYIYPEIDTAYASDDSDGEEVNTIGNIDLSLYDEYPHLGYDINGKKIMRPAKGAALDALLDTIDVPKGWTGMIDKNTGGDLRLSREELEILRKIQMDEVPVDGYDPYAVGSMRCGERTVC